MVKHSGDRTGQAKPARAKAVQVCVVDDDASVRTSIVSLLRSTGILATSHPSGEDFLAAEGLERLRCVILDVRLRTMNGLDVARRLRLAGSAAPVVFISAHADAQARERALAEGALAFLMKPFNDDELLDCVRLALAGGGGDAGGTGGTASDGSPP